MENELDFILDNMQWSFSRLNSYYHCPYEWYLTYIEDNRGANSSFTEYGTVCHKVLEEYLKGNLAIWDLEDKFTELWKEIVVDEFPRNKYVDLAETYYEQGLSYFQNINFDFDRYEILGVEKEIHFEILDKPFVGYIDLLLRDKENGNIIISDHKSSTIKKKKNGEISKQSASHFEEFKKQLYMYSKPIIAEYGKVNKLRWNLFKQNDEIVIPWNEDDYKDTIKWAEDTINLIDKTSVWLPDNSETYYCNVLCPHRNICEYRQ